MSLKITFAECLKILLKNFDINMSQLSRAINVDSSLISRWCKGTRIPPYGTSYIDNISEHLSKNIYHSYQIILLDDLLLDLYDQEDLAETNEIKIKKILLKALDYSISCKEKHHSGDMELPTRSKEIKKSLDLSSNDKLIYGTDNFFTTFISLLEFAAKKKQKKNNRIYLTYLNSLDKSFFTNDKLAYLQDAILRAIHNEWQVNILLKINHHIDRLKIAIKFFLPFIETGKVNIYYTTNYDNLMPLKELYIVSGIGALSCFPMDVGSVCNFAFYITNMPAIDVFSNYMNLLIKNNAKQLNKSCLDDTNSDYWRTLIETEEKAENQLNYNSGISMMLIPLNLYKKLLLSINITQQEVLLSLQYYEKHMNVMIANLENHTYKHICLSETMNSLLTCRTINLVTFSRVEQVTLDNHDLMEYLENIIYFLSTYENFHTAILFQNTDVIMKTKAYRYIIKEKNAVYIHVLDTTKNLTPVRIYIEEPTIVKAFGEYFNDIWNQIAPINKDKKENIAWIRNMIDFLKR